jgi:hypothetical protein
MLEQNPMMCKNCGAPLEIAYGAAVITCDYCGSSMTLAGDVAKLISKHTMLLNRITGDDAVLAAKKWMDLGILRVNVAAESTITLVEMKYLPVWTIPVNVTGNYSGVMGGGLHSAGAQMSDSFKEKNTKGFLTGLGKVAGQAALNALANQGKQRNVRQTPQTTSGVINDQYHQLILARRTTTMDLTKYPIPLSGKEIFHLSTIKSSGGELLDGDMLEDEAKTKAESDALEKSRKALSHRLDSISRLDIKAIIGEAELIHVPIWLVHYTHKGAERVCGVEGVTGLPVNGDRPTVSLGLLCKKNMQGQNEIKVPG